MNKYIVFLSLFLIINNKYLKGQTNLYAYKIELLSSDINSTPAAFFEVVLNGHRVKANQEGFIYFTRETGANYLMVSLADSKYSMVGPSYLSFPEDVKSITTILIHQKSNKENATTEYIKKLKELNIGLNGLQQNNEELVKGNQLLKQQMDSVLNIITKQYKLSDKDLRDAAEILAGRDKYFNVITACLEGYLNEAKDVRDLFKNLLVFYLVNPQSMLPFDSTINVYNKYYNNLNSNNNEYEKAVETYWQSPELALGFHSTFDYAINNIHRTTILSLNSIIVQKINMYIHEDNKKKRQIIKDELINATNLILPILDNNLVILENKIKYYIGKLESQKDILSK